MYHFEPRDEGFLILDSTGRAVASLETKDSSYEDFIDKGQIHTRLKLTPLAKEKRRIHFTGAKWTGTADLQTLLTEIAAVP